MGDFIQVEEREKKNKFEQDLRRPYLLPLPGKGRRQSRSLHC